MWDPVGPLHVSPQPQLGTPLQLQMVQEPPTLSAGQPEYPTPDLRPALAAIQTELQGLRADLAARTAAARLRRVWARLRAVWT